MQKPILSILFLFTSLIVLSQKKDLKQTLYKLEERIISGDFNALREISKYIDDTTFVQEFLGYHNYPNTARGVTMRVIEENCLFTEEELKLDSTLTGIKFSDVLNNGKVKFDEITGRFLITVINNRKTDYTLKELSEHDLKRIDTTVIKSPYPEWFHENQIDGFLFTNNPEVLLQIASAWYKKRSRFNRYYFNDEEFLDLMKKLTNVDLGVPDEDVKTTFLYEDDYYEIARLNYLIYWANHYNDYKWNSVKGYFENTKESALKKTNEEVLFSLLRSENDSIALNAFIELTELDTARVRILADDYEKNRWDKNFTIPIFPYRFLKQMVLLTRYCRDNGIRYKAVSWLIDSLNKLKEDLSFYERHHLENMIILNLDLKDVTSVEYFGLIYEQDWGVTYSIGRILDKVYSKKWKELSSDESNLKLFLKKSALFDRLGIIGNCNKYLRKFENCSHVVIQNLKKISTVTNDEDIREQAHSAISKYSFPIESKLKKIEIWEGSNYKYGATNLKNRYLAIKRSNKEEDDKKYAIKKLFGELSYNQIGESIRMLQPDTSMGADEKFDFIESDFGFDIAIDDSLALEKFLDIYFARPEYQVYEYYLKRTGMNCFTNNDSLFYPGIYDILKYNVVDAFVGGGGGREDDGVYLVIKLLELKFKTTLGFPKKRCSSQGIYSCDCEDSAKAWMKFLEERKLVTPDKTEPPSISNND